MTKRLSEGSFILAITSSLFLLLSLLSYQFSDPGWSHAARAGSQIANYGGFVGAYLADSLYFISGYAAYLLPPILVYLSWQMIHDSRREAILDSSVHNMRYIGVVFMLVGGCGLLSINPAATVLDSVHSAGGVIGQGMVKLLCQLLNVYGAGLLLLALFLVGVTLLTGLSWVMVLEVIGRYTEIGMRFFLSLLNNGFSFSKSGLDEILNKMGTTTGDKVLSEASVEEPVKLEKAPKASRERSTPLLIATPEATLEKPSIIEKQLMPIIKAATPAASVAALVVKEVALEPKRARSSKAVSVNSNTPLPGLDLLDKGTPGKPLGGYTHQILEQLSRELEQHLLDFGIQADVVAVHPGPVVTRFELQLAAGVKVSKLTALAKDLARSLSVTSVRVVEVIPGKTVVGLELPNQSRQTVRLSDVLSAEVYQQALSPLTLALGVDIAGHPMVVDLAKMPHLLVAGTTGSGKSVGINAMILSILLKATPEQVRLIMVDPKMLELSVYDGIPHLLTPVVTDMKEAASALRWCVDEMERRYKLMASVGVRNLAGYNSKIAEAKEAGEPLFNPLWKPTDSMDEVAPELQSLPYVVVVIDELADMMMVVGKKVEQLIARIAQKARAAGIHMVLATQRPSVDVLTGLIKSNIPTRISFQVSSKIDSRTILDQQGAEQLLGHGDMLYLAPGSGAPLRVHGAFVDDKEVHRIADDWRARGEPEYIEEILRTIEPGEGGAGEEGSDVEDDDPLYDQAVEFVVQTRKASISAVQRRLKIGYNRAARMIEEMERTGIVGPLDGGYRDVLISSITEE